jgi:hypothetical protein
MTFTLKRQKILTEFYNRLDNDGSGDGYGLRYVPSSSDWSIGREPIHIGIGRKQYPPKYIPTIYIIPFDSGFDSRSIVKENLPYMENFSIGVELFIKCGGNNAQTYGNMVLARIQQAIEIDKRFKQMNIDKASMDYGKLIHNSELVTSYGLSDRSVMEGGSDIVYVSTGYDFYFIEEFLGKRNT